MKSKARVAFLFIISFLFVQAANSKHRLVLTVFKPLYLKDTAIFPNTQNYETLKKTYKCQDLLVSDATVLITEFGSDKKIPVEFNKSENAYSYDLNEESFTITVQKKGFIDQKRTYQGNGHHDYIEMNGVVKLTAYLFTQGGTPVFIGKEILPYKASRNKIVLQVFDTENDSAINKAVEHISKKYNLKNISNTSCEFPFSDLRNDLTKNQGTSIPKTLLHDKRIRPYYYIILQKTKGEFSESDCAELAELRSYDWGKSSGPLLGYYSLAQTKGNFSITYLSSYIKANLTIEDLNALNLTRSKTEQDVYSCPLNNGLGWAKQLYQFHLQHPLTQISHLSTNLSFYK